MKIKIIGSGSAGNHIAFAFKNFASKIIMTDISKEALLRAKKKIYINRYKKWDQNIKQIIEGSKKEINEFYDVIIISTPPKSHINLLKYNVKKSNIFLIEKPICDPNKSSLALLKKIINNNKKKIFLCGYNHRLFPSTIKLKEIFKNHKKKFNYMSVNFKEGTEGFLKAHNWLKSLNDSYLSNWKEGGGALCEHSHALNLAQYLIDDKANNLKLFNKNIEFSVNKNTYDKNSKLFFNFKKKPIIINQNFETTPTEKKITITGNHYYLELQYNYKNNDDKILYYNFKKNKKKIFLFKKERKDDFLYEAKFLCKIFEKKTSSSTLNAKHGVDTMSLLMKALYNK